MYSPIKRTDNTEVPDSEELKLILAAEVKRDPPLEKEEVHYPEFKTIISLVSHFGSSTDIFTDDSLDIFKVVDQGRVLVEELVPKVLAKDLNDRDIAVFDSAYDYLSEEDIPEKSDVIIVFGSRSSFRPERAAELYKNKLSRKVLVTGARPIYGDDHKTEAEKYYDVLMSNGVSDSDILIEDEAISMVDNVRRSLNMLDRIELNYNSLILVNSPYSQRRGWVMFKKLLLDTVKIFRVNSETSEIYKKNNWYKNDKALRIILNEFIKMRANVVYNSA